MKTLRLQEIACYRCHQPRIFITEPFTELVTADAHATTQAEAQKVEDRIEQLVTAKPSRATWDAELSAIDATLAGLDIPTEDWDILFRLRIQAERDLLRG